MPGSNSDLPTRCDAYIARSPGRLPFIVFAPYLPDRMDDGGGDASRMAADVEPWLSYVGDDGGGGDASRMAADLESWLSYVGDADDGGGGSGGFGAVPATGVAIATLPETAAAAADERQCAVCLEGYEAGEALRTMPCAHGFHERCIFSWLLVSRLCPLCRFALPADTETEPYDDAREEDSGGGRRRRTE
ncbi:hypothetical protein ACP4OV_014503 [Aristida adscensionis]